MAQNVPDQLSHLAYMNKEIAVLVQAADPKGPFFLGPDMSIVDVHIGPFFLRLTRIFKQYRGWEESPRGSRLWVWMQAIERHEVAMSTTSSDGLSIDAFERYGTCPPSRAYHLATSVWTRNTNDRHVSFRRRQVAAG